MKYLVITEYNAGELSKYAKRNSELNVDRDKNPKKYPKRVVTGLAPLVEWPKLNADSMKAIDIVEADSEEQIENHMAFWMSAMAEMPISRKWYVPLLDVYKTMPKMKL